MKSDNPFQLTFTLRQHTPIIHFQHDQHGSTLRATEVKPKFDLFIIKKTLQSKGITWEHDHHARIIFKENALNPRDDEDKKNWKNWLIGKGKGDHVALEYKIFIHDTDERPTSSRSYGGFKLITEDIDAQNSLLPKKAIKSESIQIKILSYSKCLLELISTNVKIFFALYNFGNRQNKGWGSYFHEDHINWESVLSTLQNSSHTIFKFKGDLNPFGSFSDFYSNVLIRDIWKPLKSGINQYNREGLQVSYKKALSFKYLGERGFRWDKRWMKKEIKNLVDSNDLPAPLIYRNPPNDITGTMGPNRCSNNYFNTNDWNDSTGQDYRFVRAMFGLAEHIEFRAGSGYIYQVLIRSNDGIERFKAPITFKLYENHLYAILDEWEAMLDKEFFIEIQKKQKPITGGQPISVGNPIQVKDENDSNKTIYTPKNVTEFSMNDFLDNYFNCLNFEKI